MEEYKEVMMAGKEFHFDFGVYGITEEQAKCLFTNIVVLVEALGGHMGGGYRDYETEETTEDES